MTNNEETLLPDVNSLIEEKLRAYPENVREVALHAIRASEQLPENTVIDQLQSIVRKLAKKQGEHGL